jgi:hypothetical protein
VRTPAEAIAELLEVRQMASRWEGLHLITHFFKNFPNAEPILNSLNDPLGVYGILPWYRAQLGFNSWKIKL